MLTCNPMIVYPNAKINIGLFVVEKRSDGFHNLESVFYPIALSDELEINRIEGRFGECVFSNSGIPVDCAPESNLVVKAYHLLADRYKLPAVSVHLKKMIPFGAGLGGGSADAAFMLKALNEYFELNLSVLELEHYAAMLGSDCIFFIQNRPAFVSGRGELSEDIKLSLNNYSIVLLKPVAKISTKEAYAGIVPTPAPFDLRELPKYAPEEWSRFISNDFEKSIFPHHPQIARIKQSLYDQGALYASMTGSGSSVYGIFEKGKGYVPEAGEIEYCWQ